MSRSALASATAEHLSLTEADLTERTQSGSQTKFTNRLGWATTWLNRANVLESPSRGRYAILPAGRVLMTGETGEITLQALKQMAGTLPHLTQESDALPDDIIDAAYRELQDSLAEELLQSIRNISPASFE